MRVGCSSLDTLQFRAECSSSDEGITGRSRHVQLISFAFSHMERYGRIFFVCLCKPGLFRAEYACHGWWWEENGYSYLIATPLSRASTGARRYCFVFRETLEPQQDKLRGNGLRNFSSIADSCRRNVAPGIEGNLAFNVTSHGKHKFLQNMYTHYYVISKHVIPIFVTT